MLTIEEIWKDIDEFDGFYQVSNYGRVRSKDRITVDKNNHAKNIQGHYMSSSNNGNGYLSVIFHKDGKSKRRYIHRLVAQAFIPNPNNLPEVNHIDENRGNNVVTNLEWKDYLGNRIYGTRLERLSASNTKHSPIIQYDIDFNYIAEYKNAAQAEKIIGIKESSIYKCANKKANIVGGYIWRFKDDPNIYEFPYDNNVLCNIYQYNATTGELIKRYYNNKTASKEMKIKPTVLKKYIDTMTAIHNYFWTSYPLTEDEISKKIYGLQNLPVKGVLKDGKKWYAQIGFNKTHLNLGSYDNEIDAIRARLNKEIELYGEFNSPQSYLFSRYLV